MVDWKGDAARSLGFAKIGLRELGESSTVQSSVWLRDSDRPVTMNWSYGRPSVRRALSEHHHRRRPVAKYLRPLQDADVSKLYSLKAWNVWAGKHAWPSAEAVQSARLENRNTWKYSLNRTVCAYYPPTTTKQSLAQATWSNAMRHKHNGRDVRERKRQKRKRGECYSASELKAIRWYIALWLNTYDCDERCIDKAKIQ